MQEVVLLLQTLLEREEITAKLIIGCMYDIGTLKLINRRVRFRPANQFMQLLARYSKPMVKILAMRRLKKNGPRLIVNWLRGKVRFEEDRPIQHQPAAPPAAIAPAPMPTALEAINQAALQASNQEVLKLRSQVKTLTTLLVTVTFTLGSATLWSIWKIQTETAQARLVKTVLSDRALKSLPGQR